MPDIGFSLLHSRESILKHKCVMHGDIHYVLRFYGKKIKVKAVKDIKELNF